MRVGDTNTFIPEPYLALSEPVRWLQLTNVKRDTLYNDIIVCWRCYRIPYVVGKIFTKKKRKKEKDFSFHAL